VNANHHKDTEEGRSLVGGAQPGQPIMGDRSRGGSGGDAMMREKRRENERVMSEI